MNAHSSRVLEIVMRLLTGALTLDEASLVIFRKGALVEYKTDLLNSQVTVTTEGQHQSWQVGPFDGHHCHLDLGWITEVRFDAESVPCQGDRTNYTVWFLSAEDCGNPYRPNGVFSVTLNSPYALDGAPRLEVITPVYALYDTYSHLPGVSASQSFRVARPRELEPLCWD